MRIRAAILRGINVSGARKLPMKELKDLFETLKCGNVRTYIQSGNVVFESPDLDERVFAQRVEAAIKKRYDYDVPVLIRSMEELKRVVSSNPYLKDKGVETHKLHVTFLAGAPTRAAAAAIEGTTFGNDSFKLVGREVYVHCPDGYGNTGLNNTFFENKLHVSATTRNWRTVNEIVRIGDGH